jgi:uncharacterized protein YndB with AHSA1/START domain
MVTETRVVRASRKLAAPPERVFDAWLDPDNVGRWLFATPDGESVRCEIDARIGGKFRIDERRGDAVAEHFGEYVELDRPRRLAFTFATSFAPEAVTRVTVEIERDGDGSRVTLVHEGVWADYEERTREGWTKILDGLAGTLGDSSRP